MATDVERLVVSLEASITKFERAMAKANAVSNDNARKVEARWNKVEANLRKVWGNAFSGFTRGALGAVAGALSVTAAVNGIKSAFDKFGSIADASTASGLDSEFFQGIAYQASLAGVELETVSGALATFNKNSGLAAEGRGKMVAALKALNPELLASIQAATTQEQRIRLAADAIDQATSSAQAGAIATTLFGDAGSKLVAAFSGGAEQIDAMQEKARGLGVIISRDVIARADELGDEFDTVTQIVDLQLKQALINLGPALVGVTGYIAEWTRMLNIVLDQFNEVENRHFLNPLQNDLANTYNAMQPVKDRIAEIEAALAGGAPNGMILKLDLSDAQTQLETLTAQADALLARITELQGRSTTAAPTSSADVSDDPTGPSPEQQETTRLLFLYTNPDYTDRSQTPSNRSSRAAGGGQDGSTAASSAIDQTKAVKELIASLQEEQAQLGMTAEQQEYYNLLKQAGVTAESAYGQEILATLGPLQEQRAALEANTEAMDSLRDAAQDTLQTIIDGLNEGKSAGDIFADVLKNIGSQLTSMGMSSLFGSGSGDYGLLGELLGFDEGGYTGPGAKRKPAGVVHKGEVVWSQRDIARAGGVGVVEAMRRGAAGYADGGAVATVPRIAAIPQAGSSTSISMPVNITAPGADAAGLMTLTSEVRKLRSEMPTIAKKAMRDSKKYGQG